jgi:ATP-binding cassette subfamily C protein CydC
MSAPWTRLLRLARPERRGITLAVLLQGLTIASGIGLMGTSAWLLSKAALHPTIAALQVAIVGVRAFGVSRATFRYLERLVSHDTTLRLLARLRMTLFRALVPLAPARLLAHRGGDLLARALEDVGTLEGLFVRVLGPSLAAIGIAALVVFSLGTWSRALAVAAAVGLAAGGAVAPRLSSRLAEGPGRRLVGLRGELSARLVDGVRGAADLLAFGREGDHASALARLGREAADEQSRLARASALGGSLSVLAADLTAVAVLALAVPGVAAGRVDGVQLATVVLLTLASFEAVAPLPLAWHGLGAMREASRRLFELVDSPPAVSEPSRPGPAPIPGAPLVEVHDLRFTYPGEPRPALDGVSLCLEPGRRIAVVGPSGSGKSTLVHLLLRFWEAPRGAIRLQGRDIGEWSSDDVRARTAFAAQRAHVFTGSLRENLLLAWPSASDEKLLAVLRAVRLDALVEGLPGGLDTWVGQEGQRLSGGERQRLALARALLRSAPVLVLDEPTAHLDALTERDVLAEIVRAGEGRATLLVTHRLVALEAFDEVLVLDGGRVGERGRAAELLARGGILARLLALQRSADALDNHGFDAAGLRADPTRQGPGRRQGVETTGTPTSA